MTPERWLAHADAVRAAWEGEVGRRKVARKLDRLETKVAAGHANLVEFRNNVAAQLEEREAIARANAERRAWLDEMAKTFDVDPCGDAA